MTPNDVVPFFFFYVVDVVVFPSCICQRESGPLFGDVPEQSTLRCLMTQVWIPLTAFLHLLALKDRHVAEAPSERHTAPEDSDVQPSRRPRFEILGACILFPRRKARCLIINNLNSIHFCAGFTSRRHRRLFASLPSREETIPVILHGGIVK